MKLEEEEVTSPQDVAQGVYCRDGVHENPCRRRCRRSCARGLSVLSADKVEYRWDTEYRGDGSQNWMPACGLRPGTGSSSPRTRGGWWCVALGLTPCIGVDNGREAGGCANDSRCSSANALVAAAAAEVGSTTIGSVVSPCRGQQRRDRCRWRRHRF